MRVMRNKETRKVSSEATRPIIYFHINLNRLMAGVPLGEAVTIFRANLSVLFSK